jgi:D-alanine--poly(phosphoribitol) ligase subunit 2
MENEDKLIGILEEIEPGIDFKSQSGLVTNHILTSIDIVRLVMEISNEFEITISPMDVVPENFDSVEAIEKLIERCQEE